MGLEKGAALHEIQIPMQMLENPMPVLGLVIQQPWANLVLGKGGLVRPIEIRKWKPKVASPFELVICASKTYEAADQALAHELNIQLPTDFGKILGVVTVTAVERATPELWPWVQEVGFEGDYPRDGKYYIWHLKNPRILEKPIPFSQGRLGLIQLNQTHLEQLNGLLATG